MPEFNSKQCHSRGELKPTHNFSYPKFIDSNGVYQKIRLILPPIQTQRNLTNLH